jgi:hypothetical protein
MSMVVIYQNDPALAGEISAVVSALGRKPCMVVTTLNSIEADAIIKNSHLVITDCTIVRGSQTDFGSTIAHRAVVHDRPIIIVSADPDFKRGTTYRQLGEQVTVLTPADVRSGLLREAIANIPMRDEASTAPILEEMVHMAHTVPAMAATEIASRLGVKNPTAVEQAARILGIAAKGQAPDPEAARQARERGQPIRLKSVPRPQLV